jgi:hypothetical protein
MSLTGFYAAFAPEIQRVIKTSPAVTKVKEYSQQLEK